MLVKKKAASPPADRGQTPLAQLRQKMLEILLSRTEKTAPRIVVLKAPGAKGCARWYNI